MHCSSVARGGTDEGRLETKARGKAAKVGVGTVIRPRQRRLQLSWRPSLTSVSFGEAEVTCAPEHLSPSPLTGALQWR